MGEKSPNNQQFRQGILAAVLIVLVIVGSLGIGTGGGSGVSPSFCSPPNCIEKTSTFTVTPAGGNAFSQVVTFSPAFPKAPQVQITNVSISETFFESQYMFLAPGPSIVWAAMPNAITEIFGTVTHRQVYETSQAATPTCGLVVNVDNPGFAGSKMRIQASTDLATWINFFPDTPNSDVPIDVSGIQVANFGVQIQPVPFAGPFLRVVGLGGNGIVSPSFGLIYLECDTFANSGFANAQNITPTQFSLFYYAFIAPSNTIIIKVSWLAHI